MISERMCFFCSIWKKGGTLRFLSTRWGGNKYAEILTLQTNSRAAFTDHACDKEILTRLVMTQKYSSDTLLGSSRASFYSPRFPALTCHSAIPTLLLALVPHDALPIVGTHYLKNYKSSRVFFLLCVYLCNKRGRDQLATRVDPPSISLDWWEP
jgi:hypothetical protein